jgi:hypothetical protein
MTSSWVMPSTMSRPQRSFSLNISGMPSQRPLFCQISAGWITGIVISCPPIAFISSRMMSLTRSCTR